MVRVVRSWVQVSSLTTSLDLFWGSPLFKSSATLCKSPTAKPPLPVGIFCKSYVEFAMLFTVSQLALHG